MARASVVKADVAQLVVGTAHARDGALRREGRDVQWRQSVVAAKTSVGLVLVLQVSQQEAVRVQTVAVSFVELDRLGRVTSAV